MRKTTYQGIPQSLMIQSHPTYKPQNSLHCHYYYHGYHHPLRKEGQKWEMRSQAGLVSPNRFQIRKSWRNTILFKSSISFQAPESRTQHLEHVNICKNGEGRLCQNPGRRPWANHSFSLSWAERRRVRIS